MPGSDENINYQIRPAKSVERKMICNLISKIQVYGGLSDFRYVGMGAKYFVDFMLIHHQFGTKKMISIEAQKEKQERYEFNKPLGLIEMKYGNTCSVLPQIDDWEKQNNLVWLDYDGPFKKDVFIDIETVVKNCIEGDMLIITVNSSCGGQNQTEKRDNFKKAVEEFFDETIQVNMYTNNGIPQIEVELINKQINSVLSKRNKHNDSNLQSVQLLNILYKDSAPMLTFGTIFVEDRLKGEISYDKLKELFSFISNSKESYKLEVPCLTNKEIQYILKKFPFDENDYSSDDFYGISLNEIKGFEKIYRYYPYYSEGGYNN